MLEILKDIDIDIKRCEEIIRENNYLEIIIAIEELNDKYRSKIQSLAENENDVVWNYSRKNLEEIEYHLKKYKEKIILEEKEKTISEKLKEIRQCLDLGKSSQNEVIVNEIYKIEEIYNNKILNLDGKYNMLIKSFDKIKDVKREIGISILEIIILMTK